MQRIYEPQDLLEAELLLGMLASEGVEAHLAGRHLLGAVGELPALGLLGLAHCILDLTKDLRLADDHRVQPARDAESVAYGGGLLMYVKIGGELFLADLMVASQPVDQCGRDFGCAVDFGAVAGGQDGGFADTFRGSKRCQGML